MESTLNNQKISIWNVVKIGGLFAAWGIGSGFVTGQEVLQYFAGFGIWGYAAIALAMGIHCFLNYSFFSLGFEKRYTNPLDIFEYYTGNKMTAKIFQVMSVALLASAPIVMISGFGAAVEQYFHIDHRIGNVICGIIVLAIVLLGLKKFVDLCGAVSPITVALAVFTGAYYLFTHLDGVAQGIQIAPTLDFNKIAPVWFMAAYYYVCPLHSAPLLAAAATTCKTKKEAVLGGFLGVAMYAVPVLIMVTAQFSNIEEVSKQMIPNLYMATFISPILSILFVALIFVEIINTVVPCFLTLLISFTKEKTNKFYTLAAAMCVIATLISLTLPFDKLFGLIYGAFGFCGGMLILVMLYRHIKNAFAHNSKISGSIS
jgi:uncharacterized membrane protein YkvI